MPARAEMLKSSFARSVALVAAFGASRDEDRQPFDHELLLAATQIIQPDQAERESLFRLLGVLRRSNRRQRADGGGLRQRVTMPRQPE